MEPQAGPQRQRKSLKTFLTTQNRSKQRGEGQWYGWSASVAGHPRPARPFPASTPATQVPPLRCLGSVPGALRLLWRTISESQRAAASTNAFQFAAKSFQTTSYVTNNTYAVIEDVCGAQNGLQPISTTPGPSCYYSSNRRADFDGFSCFNRTTIFKKSSDFSEKKSPTKKNIFFAIYIDRPPRSFLARSF